MGKILLILASMLLLTSSNAAEISSQKKPILLKKSLLQKIITRPINSSNADEIEKLLGPASACIPTSVEVWTCQWKGNLSSNGVTNTINITFEAGALAKVVVVSRQGDFQELSAKAKLDR